MEFDDFYTFAFLFLYFTTIHYLVLFAHDNCPTKAFVDWLSIRKVTRVFAFSFLSLFSSNSLTLLVLRRPTTGRAGSPRGPPQTSFGRLGLMLRTCTELLQVTLLPLARSSLALSSSPMIRWKCEPPLARELIVPLACAGLTGYASRVCRCVAVLGCPAFQPLRHNHLTTSSTNQTLFKCRLQMM